MQEKKKNQEKTDGEIETLNGEPINPQGLIIFNCSVSEVAEDI